MKKLWFKNKTYGYGWVPCSWQGWLCLGIFLAFNILNFLRIDSHSHSVSDTLINFVPPFLLTIILLIVIAIKKGERPRWHWGEESDETNKDQK